MSRVLIDNEATPNILLASMLKKLHKKKFDRLPTDLIITNFYGLISIKLTIGRCMTKTIFFSINVATTYNVVLG